MKYKTFIVTHEYNQYKEWFYAFEETKGLLVCD